MVPLYWAGTLLVFTVALVAPALMNSTSADPVQLVKSLLFIPFQKADVVRPVLFLGWTLNYEMFFYAVFFVCMKASHEHRALLCAAVLAGIVALGQWLGPVGVVADFYANALQLEFVTGMACFYLFRAARARGLIGARPWTALLLCVLVLGFLYAAPAQDGLVTRVAVWGLPALWLFVIALWGGGAAQLPSWLTLLGDASYSLYLFHPYLIQALDKKLHLFSSASPLRATAASVLAIGLCCGFAIAVYVWVERPLTRWLRGRWARRAPAEDLPGDASRSSSAIEKAPYAAARLP